MCAPVLLSSTHVTEIEVLSVAGTAENGSHLNLGPSLRAVDPTNYRPWAYTFLASLGTIGLARDVKDGSVHQSKFPSSFCFTLSCYTMGTSNTNTREDTMGASSVDETGIPELEKAPTHETAVPVFVEGTLRGWLAVLGG